jgi:hypothetical protein
MHSVKDSFLTEKSILQEVIFQKKVVVLYFVFPVLYFFEICVFIVSFGARMGW